MNARSAHGHTLVEVMIVVAVLVGIAVTAMDLVVQSNNADRFAREMTRATELNQRVVGDVERELVASAALYTNDPIGNAYRAALDVSSGAPPLTSTMLATTDINGRFEMEAAPGQKSGNALLFARLAWATEYRCASGREYRIDVYRVVYYYLTRVGRGPRPASESGVTLCKFVSEPMADADQVDAVTDPIDLPELLLHLAGETPDVHGVTHDEVQLVWHRHADPGTAGTFRQIDKGTGTLSMTPLAPRSSPWRITADRERTTLGMLTWRGFGVASNHAPRSFGVAWFSVVDNTGDGFPHGLEVQVIGPSFNRQMMVHLAIASARGPKPAAHSQVRSQSMLRVR